MKSRRFSEKLKDYFHIRSLRAIIALSFIAIMAIVYGITYYFLSQKYTDTMRRNIESVSMQVTDELENAVHSFIRDVADLSEYLSVQLYLQDTADKEHIKEMLTSASSGLDGINLIAVFDAKGGLLASTRDASLKDGLELTAQPWFVMADKSRNEPFFSEPHIQDLSYGEYDWVVSLSRRITRYDSPPDARAGHILLIDIDVAALYGKSARFRSTSGAYAYLLDGYGNVIVHPKMRQLRFRLASEDTDLIKRRPDGSFVTHGGGVERYTVIKTIPYTGWRLVYCNRGSELMAPWQDLTRFLFVTLAIGIAVIIATSWTVSTLMTRPLKQLGGAMAQADKGRFDTVANVRGDTEVERLSLAYNHMIERIRALMDEIVREQEEKRRSELRALQMQIQPHFLYNTLESIIWSAERGNNRDVVKMTAALSRLFRISLGKGETASVGEELMLVRHYLTIQEMRYKDRLAYEIHATSEALGCSIIRLLLQPIVENAIYHGIREMEEKGSIIIQAWTAQGSLYITVQDDGMGMEPQEIERVFQDDFISTKGSGIGVKNIRDRVHLYYGKAYGLSITSSPGEGTLVMLTLPSVLNRTG